MIETGTYLCAAATIGGKLEVNNVNPTHMLAVTSKLEELGCYIQIGKDSIRVEREQALKPVNITTMPYPGFSTDIQAQFMALLTQAHGTSTIRENLFENRFQHVPELRRMGAKIEVDRNIASITGPAILTGTDVTAKDLRGGAGLLIAGLVANGVTTVHEMKHILRGYENLPQKLSDAGVTSKPC